MTTQQHKFKVGDRVRVVSFILYCGIKKPNEPIVGKEARIARIDDNEEKFKYYLDECEEDTSARYCDDELELVTPRPTDAPPSTTAWDLVKELAATGEEFQCRIKGKHVLRARVVGPGDCGEYEVLQNVYDDPHSDYEGPTHDFRYSHEIWEDDLDGFEFYQQDLDRGRRIELTQQYLDSPAGTYAVIKGVGYCPEDGEYHVQCDNDKVYWNLKPSHFRFVGLATLQTANYSRSEPVITTNFSFSPFPINSLLNPQKTMTSLQDVTVAAKRLLSPALRAQVKAGFRNSDLSLTTRGREQLMEIAASQAAIEKEFTKAAKDELKE